MPETNLRQEWQQFVQDYGEDTVDAHELTIFDFIEAAVAAERERGIKDAARMCCPDCGSLGDPEWHEESRVFLHNRNGNLIYCHSTAAWEAIRQQPEEMGNYTSHSASTSKETNSPASE